MKSGVPSLNSETTSSRQACRCPGILLRQLDRLGVQPHTQNALAGKRRTPSSQTTSHAVCTSVRSAELTWSGRLPPACGKLELWQKITSDTAMEGVKALAIKSASSKISSTLWQLQVATDLSASALLMLLRSATPAKLDITGTDLSFTLWPRRHL